VVVHGDYIHVDDLVPEKPVFKEIGILVSIPIATICLIGITGTIPLSLLYDSYRHVKYQHILHMKHKRNHPVFTN
jgi:hypothetical protein